MRIFKNLRYIVMAVGVGVLLTSCMQAQQEQSPIQLTPVEVERASVGDIARTYIVAGSIAPIREVAVIPKMVGKVEEVTKNIGSQVEKDEVLFSIETDALYRQIEQIDAQIQQSRASEELANLNLARTQGSSMQQQMMQAEQGVEQAKISYTNAKEDYEKNVILYEAGAISKQMIDGIKTQYELAQIQYKSAKENDDLLKQSIAQESVQTAKVQLSQAQAGTEAMQAQRRVLMQQIEDAKVKAPISGIIADKNIQAGQMASQQLPAFTIVDMDTVVIQTHVTEGVIHQISRGQKALVSVSALGDQAFEGVIDEVSPAITGQSTGYSVKVRIDNAAHKIKPGMFAEVNFIIESKSKAVLVPIDSVMRSNLGRYVYLVEDHRVVRREVKTGIKDRMHYEITSGLEAGEPIIIKGQHFVVDGERVRLVGGERQ